jgi:hypothetical protein
MEATVKKDFYHAKRKKGFKIGDTFSGDELEIERINSIVKNALEIEKEKEIEVKVEVPKVYQNKKSRKKR